MRAQALMVREEGWYSPALNTQCVFVASAVLGGGDGAGDLRLFSLVSR